MFIIYILFIFIFFPVSTFGAVLDMVTDRCFFKYFCCLYLFLGFKEFIQLIVYWCFIYLLFKVYFKVLAVANLPGFLSLPELALHVYWQSSLNCTGAHCLYIVHKASSSSLFHRTHLLYNLLCLQTWVDLFSIAWIRYCKSLAANVQVYAVTLDFKPVIFLLALLLSQMWC